MKKLIASILTALMFSTASAAEKKASVSEVCDKASDLAGAIMDFRQMGGTAYEQMSTNGKSDLGRRLVLESFKTPRYSAKEDQEQASADFKSKTRLECIAALKKKK